MTGSNPQSDLELENAELRRKLTDMQHLISDLEKALSIAVEHGDIIEQQLLEANDQLQTEINERAASQRRLRELVDAIDQQKLDLEIIVGTLIEHGDSVDQQMWKDLLASEMRGAMDALTGLHNRHAFDDHLLEHFNSCARHARPLSLLMIDVDFFKSFNDLYGHAEGDECLKQVASVLMRYASRAADMAARYGGEEFSIILPETDAEGAHALAKSIVDEIRTLGIRHQGSKIGGVVTASIGCKTLIPKTDQAPRALIVETDHLLYRAKQLGRDQACAEGPEGYRDHHAIQANKGTA